eukprot:scaffold19433_cov112-Isochrysis_galbana.AAC.3
MHAPSPHQQPTRNPDASRARRRETILCNGPYSGISPSSTSSLPAMLLNIDRSSLAGAGAAAAGGTWGGPGADAPGGGPARQDTPEANGTPAGGARSAIGGGKVHSCWLAMAGWQGRARQEGGQWTPACGGGRDGAGSSGGGGRAGPSPGIGHGTPRAGGPVRAGRIAPPAESAGRAWLRRLPPSSPRGQESLEERRGSAAQRAAGGAAGGAKGGAPAGREVPRVGHCRDPGRYPGVLGRGGGARGAGGRPWGTRGADGGAGSGGGVVCGMIVRGGSGATGCEACCCIVQSWGVSCSGVCCCAVSGVDPKVVQRS